MAKNVKITQRAKQSKGFNNLKGAMERSRIRVAL
jgi:hypothetical protein